MNEPKTIPLDLPYNPEDKMMTPTQAADYIGVSMVSIGRYLNLKTNALPSYRISNRVVRIKPSELYEWLEKRKGTSEDYKKSMLRLGNYKQ